MKIVSISVDETILAGKNFAKTLKGGDVVLLDGTLGVGKTHFVKGVALGLEIDDVITSPTFTLHNTYKGKSLLLNHFDFYRIEDDDEAEQLGLTEIFFDNTGVCFVEWWQNVVNLLPNNTRKVSIRVISDTVREIIIDE